MSSKSDFPAGTRVRVIAFEHEAPGNEKIGKTGTVVAPDYRPRDTQFVFVNIDGDGLNDFPLRPSEIEAILTPLIREDIDALPIGSVIKDSDGDTYERTSETLWTRTPSSSKWGPMVEQPNWEHSIVHALPESFAPVVLVSSPESAPEAPTAPDVAARLTALVAEIATETADIEGDQAAIAQRRRDLNRKTILAAQYRAVLADLEAQK